MTFTALNCPLVSSLSHHTTPQAPAPIFPSMPCSPLLAIPPEDNYCENNILMEIRTTEAQYL